LKMLTKRNQLKLLFNSQSCNLGPTDPLTLPEGCHSKTISTRTECLHVSYLWDIYYMCAKLGILNPNGFRENDQKVDQSRICVAFAVHCRAPPRRVHWHLARIL